jgi:anti-sigma factor RsiW
MPPDVGYSPKPHHGPWHPSRVTCREFSDFIMDYLSGELPFESRRRFVRHLRLCPNCCRYLASYEQTVKLGKHAFADDAAPVPPDVSRRLRQSRPRRAPRFA